MDMNLFRKHLAKQQHLTERHPAAQNLAHRLSTLTHAAQTKAAILDEVDSIWASVQELPISSRNKKMLSDELDELITAIKTNDHSDAEVLIDTLTTALLNI